MTGEINQHTLSGVRNKQDVKEQVTYSITRERLANIHDKT